MEEVWKVRFLVSEKKQLAVRALLGVHNMISITILNWENYQKRTDAKHPTWFAFSNRAWVGQTVSRLSFTERWAWIVFLSLASEKKSPIVEFDINWLSRISEIPKKDIFSAIEKLEQNQCISMSRTEHVQNPYESVQVSNESVQNFHATNKQTNKHNERSIASNGKADSPPDYVTYPDQITGEWVADQFGEWDEVLKIYPDEEWVVREMSQLALWLTNNPHKRSKSLRGFRQRIVGWLRRGWERHCKTLPSNKPQTAAFDHDRLWEKPCSAAK